MASSEDFKKLYELYQTNGLPNGVSLVDFCQLNGSTSARWQSAFMDSFVIEDLYSEVPVDEDGKAQGLGGGGILGLLMRDGATRMARGLGTR